MCKQVGGLFVKSGAQSISDLNKYGGSGLEGVESETFVGYLYTYNNRGTNPSIIILILKLLYHNFKHHII